MELKERFFADLTEYNKFIRDCLKTGLLITPVSVVPMTIGFRVYYTSVIL